MGWLVALPVGALVAGAVLALLADRPIATVWAVGAVLGLLLLAALGCVGLVLRVVGVLA